MIDNAHFNTFNIVDSSMHLSTTIDFILTFNEELLNINASITTNMSGFIYDEMVIKIRIRSSSEPMDEPLLLLSNKIWLF